MGVHLSSKVLADPLLAEEPLEELGAVLEVVAAHPPLPRFPVLDAGRVVAGAALHAARAACLGEGVGQRRRRNRQEKGRLFKGCDQT